MKKITAWIVKLQDEQGCTVLLHVYEERVSEDKDALHTCDCCRNMGELLPFLEHAPIFALNLPPHRQAGKTIPSAAANTISSFPAPRCCAIRCR